MEIQEQDLDLTQELLSVLYYYQIRPEIISLIRNNDQFQYAIGKPSSIQRALLTNVLFKLILEFNDTPPREIRLALNIATNDKAWLSDVKLYLAPYIKIQENQHPSFKEE